MNKHEMQEVMQEIVNKLHTERYLEAMRNGANHKEAMKFADDNKLYLKASKLFGEVLELIKSMDEIVSAVERDNTTHHVFIVEGGVGKMWGPISYHSTYNKAQKEIETLVAMGNSKDRLRIVEQVVY